MKKASILFGGLLAASIVLVSWNSLRTSEPEKEKMITPAKGGNSHVNGGGTLIEGDERSTFVFNAVQLPDGSVNGHLNYNFRAIDVEIKMDIDCIYFITPKRATISGIITQVKGPDVGVHVGGKAAVTVEDNGNGKGKDFIGELEIQPEPSDPNYVENLCPVDWGTFFAIDGNITVKQ
jgi:hypothetical protein